MTNKYKLPALSAHQVETFKVLQEIGGLADIGMLIKHGGCVKAADDLVSLGLVEKIIYSLSEDHEWRLKNYSSYAHMFLVFAEEEDTCEINCFMTPHEAMCLASALLQGPANGEDSKHWESAMNNLIDYQTKAVIYDAKTPFPL